MGWAAAGSNVTRQLSPRAARSAGLLGKVASCVTRQANLVARQLFRRAALNEAQRVHAQSHTGSTECPTTAPARNPAKPAPRHRAVASDTCSRVQAPWASLHADLNGAYNILRKVFLHFQWHAALPARFTLLWLSPKKGLTEFAQRSVIPLRGGAGALPVL